MSTFASLSAQPSPVGQQVKVALEAGDYELARSLGAANPFFAGLVSPLVQSALLWAGGARLEAFRLLGEASVQCVGLAEALSTWAKQEGLDELCVPLHLEPASWGEEANAWFPLILQVAGFREMLERLGGSGWFHELSVGVTQIVRRGVNVVNVEDVGRVITAQIEALIGSFATTAHDSFR